MAIYCAYNAHNNVVFTDNLGATRIVSPAWPGDFRMQDVDGGGVVGFLANGGVITPYVAPAPSTNPADYPLTMRQLRLALLTLGNKPVDFVASVVAKISDPTQKGLATIWYEETVDNIQWNNAETQLLIAASGLPLDQAAALWLKAKDL